MQKVKDKSNNFKTFLQNLPSGPGVYFFYSAKQKLLYIGKAKNLKKRIKSYFTKAHNLSPAKETMIQKTKKIAYQQTSSEIEALLKEAQLIKKLKPRFNVAFRDDTFYPYIKITQEAYPRVSVTHRREKDGACYFGPFIRSRDARLTLQILRKTFPFRSCKHLPSRPCLDYYIKLCPGVCLEKNKKKLPLSSKDRKKIYKNNIEQIIRFLQGKNQKILTNLKTKIHQAAKEKKYELAQELLTQLQALERIHKHKDSSLVETLEIQQPDAQVQLKKEFEKILHLKKLPQRIEAYDLSNIQGRFAVGSMVVFSLKRGSYEPQKNQYRRFKIKSVEGISDIEMLKEVLQRRLRHKEWTKPDLILLDGGKAQLNIALQVLNKKDWSIPLLALAKRKEVLYLEHQKKPLCLSPSSPLLKLLQALRDEAHRFALSYYRLRHRKGIYE